MFEVWKGILSAAKTSNTTLTTSDRFCGLCVVSKLYFTCVLRERPNYVLHCYVGDPVPDTTSTVHT